MQRSASVAAEKNSYNHYHNSLSFQAHRNWGELSAVAKAHTCRRLAQLASVDEVERNIRAEDIPEFRRFIDRVHATRPKFAFNDATPPYHSEEEATVKAMGILDGFLLPRLKEDKFSLARSLAWIYCEEEEIWPDFAMLMIQNSVLAATPTNTEIFSSIYRLNNNDQLMSMCVELFHRNILVFHEDHISKFYCQSYDVWAPILLFAHDNVIYPIFKFGRFYVKNCDIPCRPISVQARVSTGRDIESLRSSAITEEEKVKLLHTSKGFSSLQQSTFCAYLHEIDRASLSIMSLFTQGSLIPVRLLCGPENDILLSIKIIFGQKLCRMEEIAYLLENTVIRDSTSLKNEQDQLDTAIFQQFFVLSKIFDREVVVFHVHEHELYKSSFFYSGGLSSSDSIKLFLTGDRLQPLVSTRRNATVWFDKYFAYVLERDTKVPLNSGYTFTCVLKRSDDSHTPSVHQIHEARYQSKLKKLDDGSSSHNIETEQQLDQEKEDDTQQEVEKVEGQQSDAEQAHTTTSLEMAEQTNSDFDWRYYEARHVLRFMIRMTENESILDAVLPQLDTIYRHGHLILRPYNHAEVIMQTTKLYKTIKFESLIPGGISTRHTERGHVFFVSSPPRITMNANTLETIESYMGQAYGCP